MWGRCLVLLWEQVDHVKVMDDNTTAIVGFTKIGTYVQNAPQVAISIENDVNFYEN